MSTFAVFIQYSEISDTWIVEFVVWFIIEKYSFYWIKLKVLKYCFLNLDGLS